LPDYSTNAVQVNFNGNTCTANQRATLNTEFNQAYEMAQVTKDNLQSGNYYDYFFDQGSRNTPGFADRTRNVLDRIHNSESLDLLLSFVFGFFILSGSS
jgi:hypothetical protein